MDFTPEAWERLGALFRDARNRLGMGRAEFGLRAGISEKAVYNAETGEPHKTIPPSFPKYAAALDWTPDSIRAVLNGGEPRRVGPTHRQAAQADRPAPPSPAPAVPEEPTLLDLLTRVHEFGRLAVMLGADGKIRDALDATAQRLVQSIPRDRRADEYGLAAYRPHAPGEGPAADDTERILRAMEEGDEDS